MPSTPPSVMQSTAMLSARMKPLYSSLSPPPTRTNRGGSLTLDVGLNLFPWKETNANQANQITCLSMWTKTIIRSLQYMSMQRLQLFNNRVKITAASWFLAPFPWRPTREILVKFSQVFLLQSNKLWKRKVVYSPGWWWITTSVKTWLDSGIKDGYKNITFEPVWPRHDLFYMQTCITCQPAQCDSALTCDQLSGLCTAACIAHCTAACMAHIHCTGWSINTGY